MSAIPDFVVNKAVLGELTLGEVWELVRDRVHFVEISESEFKWGPFENVSFTPGVKIEFSMTPLDDRDPDSWESEYSFSLDKKVKLMGDHVEFDDEDPFGEVKSISLYFMFNPDPQPIKLNFLISEGLK